jgi:UDP-2,4-diacetamido-2,4,6-trideoxy-beta-L-altropyranose hydrolase
MSIIIRVDASLQIGTGHVMRCMTLAEELRERGTDVIFICRDDTGNLNNYIRKDKRFSVQIIRTSKQTKASNIEDKKRTELEEGDWKTDAEAVQKILENLSFQPKWLVVDNYELDYRWEQFLKPYVGKLMVIDDLANRRHDCDILLDQNFTNDRNRYKHLVPNNCTQLIGPGYVLLRKEFAVMRKSIKQSTGEVKRILVFFGGVDRTNQTEKTLKAIKKLNRPDITVDVVLGKANQNKNKIEMLIASIPNAAVHIQVNNMAELMADADLAIGAGGSTTWERCSLGLPSIVISTAENQETLSRALADNQCIDYLGPGKNATTDSIREAVLRLCGDKKRLQKLSLKNKKLVDVKGTERIIKAVTGAFDVERLILRKAKEGDLLLYYEWANDPKVRKNSFSSAPIKLSDHKTWFQRKRNSKNSFLYIFEYLAIPIGQIRFDVDGSLAEIDYSIDSKYRGEGFGYQLLKKGIDQITNELINKPKFTAKVKTSNLASKRVFEKIGFKKEICRCGQKSDPGFLFSKNGD